jgi:UDP-3-O-[3-hydroxymyristoyl] N-acetylglucosamine deacetylase
VEHVLAALAGLAVDDAVVELDADEPPAGDGSAACFVALVERAGRRRQGGRRAVARLVAPVSVVDGARSISVEPADALAIDYTIDFDAPAVGRQSLRLESIDEAVFRREIARARTFGFLDDVEALRAAGLARGASLENTVVIDGSHIVNADGLRWPDECVRHKVLDLLGDLVLFGHPLVGRVRVHRGGHALHHALLRRLADTPGSWRLEDAPPAV